MGISGRALGTKDGAPAFVESNEGSGGNTSRVPGNNVEVPARCVTTPAEIPECDTVSNAGGYVISAVRT